MGNTIFEGHLQNIISDKRLSNQRDTCTLYVLPQGFKLLKQQELYFSFLDLGLHFTDRSYLILSLFSS